MHPRHLQFTLFTLWIPEAVLPYPVHGANAPRRYAPYATAWVDGQWKGAPCRVRTLQFLFWASATEGWHVRALTEVECTNHAHTPDARVLGLHASADPHAEPVAWYPIADPSSIALALALDPTPPFLWRPVPGGTSTPTEKATGYQAWSVGPLLEPIGIETSDGCVRRNPWWIPGSDSPKNRTA